MLKVETTCDQIVISYVIIISIHVHSVKPHVFTLFIILINFYCKNLVQECHDSEIIDGHRHEGWNLAAVFPVEGPKCKHNLGCM